MTAETSQAQTPATPAPPARPPSRGTLPYAIAGGVLGVLLIGGLLVHRFEAGTNKVPLSDSAKGATVVEARAASWQLARRYVGTIEPWVEAKIGPQFTSAFVETVLVRPGAVVKRGQVLATLDCRTASADSKAVEMQAKAVSTRQEALAHEAARLDGLLVGGFISPNEVEQKSAESLSKQAELLATRAKLVRASLQESDCILRAPFDGEIASRSMDPGGFARPGATIAVLVDRHTVRVTADVPEVDFNVVAPGTRVLITALALGTHLSGSVSRRAPSADLSTRTVRFEVDLSDEQRTLPVGTTAELEIDVGKPQPATAVPLTAASVRGANATVTVVEGGIAHKRKVPMLGERLGVLFLDPSLKEGSHVITEGRSQFAEGDRANAKLVAAPELLRPSALGEAALGPAKTGERQP